MIPGEARNLLYGLRDNGFLNSLTAYGPGQCTTACMTAPFCGDGIVERSSGEICDDGLTNGAPTDRCRADCKLKCGDGVVDPGEQCDDGAANNTGGYGRCTAICTLGGQCGDGIKNGPEQCDNGANTGAYGTCNPGCTLAPYCGDGVKNGTEQCDNGAQNSLTAYGPGQCTTACMPAPFCGDGIVERSSGEICDDGLTNGAPTDRCRADCKLKCGDGVVDPGEQCDDGAANNTGGYGKCTSRTLLAGYRTKNAVTLRDRFSMRALATPGPRAPWRR